VAVALEVVFVDVPAALALVELVAVARPAPRPPASRRRQKVR